jgi:hypothetical protein
MTTIIVVLIVWWLTVRIIHLVGGLWRLANGESSARVGEASAA